MKQYQLSGAVAIAALVCCMHSKTFAQTDWHITGNSGTSAATNFVGTTDNVPLVFRTNNAIRMRINGNGNIGIGTTAPVQKLDVNGNINIGAGFSLFMENRRVLRVDSLNRNIFLGNGTGAGITSGHYNTATGYYALAADTYGSFNAAYGVDALRFNTSGGYNTAIGTYAMRYNSSGSDNTATGIYAMYNNATGSYNVAYGESALSQNTAGNNNAAYGYRAMYYNNGYENVGIGKLALYSNGSGSYNTATGAEALYANTASYNTATGYRALYANTTGYDNSAHGWEALYSNTTGVYNTAHGLASLYSNITGNYNTAVGTYALYNTSYSSNNTAVGDIAGSSYQNGWNNTFIGAWADATGPDIYNSVAIGNVSRVTAPNQVRLGNSSTTSIGGYASWSNISDGRVKKNIKENVPGLTFINKLKPVTYNLDLDAADKFTQNPALKTKDEKTMPAAPNDATARSLKQQVLHTGFIAQDVEKAAKELNYDFSGVDAAKNDKDLYALRYAEFVVLLVKAVQELSQQNEEMKNKIEKLEAVLSQNNSGSVSATASANVTITDATLGQNTPNPFNRTTTISYTLPQKFSSAQIIINDQSGRVVKQVNVSAGGKGVVNIDAASLSSGTYSYALVVDGKRISSKQMVLAK